MTKHEAVWEWLQGCPYITDLFFNAARADGGYTQLVPAESVTAEYIDGTSLRQYECSLIRFMELSFEPNDEANLRDAIDFDRLGEWVNEQNDMRNFPAFPEAETVQGISVSPNQGGYMVMLQDGMAKYMLQFQIEYLKER